MLINNKRSWTEINLSLLKNNYEIYRSLLPVGTKIIAVVKADAYGHGDYEIAKLLQKEGVTDFAVATIEEAIGLRCAGIKGHILVLGYSPLAFAQQLIDYDIIQTVVDENHAKFLSDINKNIKVVFSIDTGMNRIGLDADKPDYCSKVIREYTGKLQVYGIFTHLCVADTLDEDSQNFTEKQIEKFEVITNIIKDLKLPYVHCLNSAAGLWYKCSSSAFARLGIVLYGLKPDFQNTLPEGIKPALSWYSVVSMVKDVFPGETVGYGRSFLAKKQMRLATVCVGYADGYNRHLSNNFFVLINGKKAPIVGRVCMDQLMVDITNIENVELGSKVTLIGHDGDETITADEMANKIGTIGYEIVCNISKRVTRIFI